MSPPELSRYERILTAFAASRPGSWFYLNVANPIDRRLLPLTGGRISVSLGQPVLCLEVVGAKSGQVRRTPLLFREVDGQLVMVASATGRPKHPAWYHNVKANPRVTVYAPGGRSGEYVAHVASPDERERLWPQMVHLYPGFKVYEGRTEGIREIPIVVLTRALVGDQLGD
jgi:deazaflavin-dependent oxidoreductase (nitroreductase family)